MRRRLAIEAKEVAVASANDSRARAAASRAAEVEEQAGMIVEEARESLKDASENASEMSAIFALQMARVALPPPHVPDSKEGCGSELQVVGAADALGMLCLSAETKLPMMRAHGLEVLKRVAHDGTTAQRRAAAAAIRQLLYSIPVPLAPAQQRALMDSPAEASQHPPPTLSPALADEFVREYGVMQTLVWHSREWAIPSKHWDKAVAVLKVGGTRAHL